MKKLLILLFSILISFNSYGETQQDYYSNGQIKSETNYKDGNSDGKWTYWYKSGKKKLETNYKDDKKHGKWIGWHYNVRKSGKQKSE